MGQILNNLVRNAVTYRPGGLVQVSLQRTAAGWALGVSDTGPGIAPERLARLFEPYQAVDSHGVRQAQGVGLGLPLVWQLAELVGGGVQIENRLGAGLTVTVTLPLTVPGAAHPE